MTRGLVPAPVGELLDKLTILQIKCERIEDPAKLDNVRREYEILREVWQQQGKEGDAQVAAILEELKRVNEKLWDIEDAIRAKEARQQFDGEFVELARSVYFTNDRRAMLKRRLNLITGSELVEEKSYAAYGGPEPAGD